MYQLLTLLTGVTLAVMISINGSLTSYVGMYLAAIIIHIVGSGFAGCLCAVQKEKKPLFGHHPLWIYLGGAIGVLTTFFNNMAFGYINMTGIIALGLLGQTITALIIDTFGLFGMKKQPFHQSTLYGLIFSVLGIVCMLKDTTTTAVMAVFVSICAGISVVLSRTVNARLSEKIGALRGSLINHLVGLPITVFILLFMIGSGHETLSVSVQAQPWMFTGGLLGVMVILLCNLTVLRVAAFQLTILTFVGQVFTGILLDFVFLGNYSETSLISGVIIAFGTLLMVIADRRQSDKRLKISEGDNIQKNEQD